MLREVGRHLRGRLIVRGRWSRNLGGGAVRDSLVDDAVAVVVDAVAEFTLRDAFVDAEAPVGAVPIGGTRIVEPVDAGA